MRGNWLRWIKKELDDLATCDNTAMRVVSDTKLLLIVNKFKLREDYAVPVLATE